MRIHNIRMGLATNSSSTHSMVFMPEGCNVTTDEYGDFGWEAFTAFDRTSKENYLGYTLQYTLEKMVGESNAEFLLNALFPNRDNFANQLKHAGYGIDHQSIMSMPVNWDGKGVNLEFFNAFKDYILNNPIAILGGNDNGGDYHPLKGQGPFVEFGLPEDYGFQAGLVARNDGKHWVIFNRENGAKVRLDFSTKTAKTDAVTKARLPELVDIKITDYCPFGCEFCYQSSTKDGKHAEFELLDHMAWAFNDMNVFEVALGGGEPTLHPQFLGILNSFRRFNVIPNFTTKNLAWLKGEHADEILEACGAFAYSASNGADVVKLWEGMQGTKHKDNWGYYSSNGKASVQYVLNTGGDLYGLLKEAQTKHIRVTILGFKEVGFGHGFKQVPEDFIGILQKVKEESRWMPYIGVDTAVVQQYGDRLKELGVHEVFMTSEEGKFSMYVDAVAKEMAPSSYCDPSKYEDLPLDKDYRGKPINYLDKVAFEVGFERY